MSKVGLSGTLVPPLPHRSRNHSGFHFSSCYSTKDGPRRLAYPLRLVFGAVVLSASCGIDGPARATVPEAQEMRNVCRNWLSVIVHERGGWGGSDEPTVADVTYLRDGATMLAGVYAIQPAGFVVVPALRELPPVKAHSDVGSLTPEFADGLLEVLRLELANRVAAYRARFGSLEVEPGADEEWVRRDHLAWEALAQDPSQFRVSRWGAAEEHGPLLTSEWHQGEPYSELCPIGSQGWPCPTGCAATAVAQIMRYHEWPPNGLEEISYWWDGDDSCGDPTPPGRELFADLRNPYAWESMPDRCERDGPPEERAALAELCYEIGVAAFMDYGDCNSATTTSSVATALVERFGYHRVLQFLNRAGRTRTEWFSILRDEIDAGRPVYYDILSHAGVVDGWRDDGGLLQIHFNYGWGGPQNAWYGLDEIPGSPGVDFESMLRRIMPANQNPFIVYPDRSGGFATVQDAVNAALDGDVIELADGVFRGPGNRDVVTSNHIITIRSRNGNPARCILDVEGTPDELHRGFILNHHGLLLEGITIRGGYAASAAGVQIRGSDQLIRNCRFQDCQVELDGGAIAAYSAGARLEDCLFERCGRHTVSFNRGDLEIDGCTFLDGRGAAVYLSGDHLTIDGCTIVGQKASAAILVFGGAAEIRNTIVAKTLGRSLDCYDAQLHVSCCDFWNNGGDWVGCVQGLVGVDGNFSGDPLFCGALDGGYWLQATSPCAAEANPDCGQIGAWPVNCGVAGLEPTEADPVPWIRIAPNPARSEVSIELGTETIPAQAFGTDVRSLRIVSVDGRVIRTLPIEEGRSTGWTWNCRDEAGHEVPSGVYFVRLAGRQTLQRSVLVLR